MYDKILNPLDGLKMQTHEIKDLEEITKSKLQPSVNQKAKSVTKMKKLFIHKRELCDKPRSNVIKFNDFNGDKRRMSNQMRVKTYMKLKSNVRKTFETFMNEAEGLYS